MTVPNLILGTLIATLLGVSFHLWRGGNLGRLIFYILASWFGFWFGHLIGNLTGLKFFSIGPLRLGMAILVTIPVLFLGHWLVSIERESEQDEA
jgi:hypothetical protein